MTFAAKTYLFLTFSWRRSLSYRNQSIDLSIDLGCKSMEWLVYDMDLRHERVNFRILATYISPYVCKFTYVSDVQTHTYDLSWLICRINTFKLFQFWY